MHLGALPVALRSSLLLPQLSVHLSVSISCTQRRACTQGEDCQPDATDVDKLKLYFSPPDATLDIDPLQWWPRHDHEKLCCLPCLRRMARRLLGVPASSAAVERLFSGVGQDFSKQRQCTTEETL